MPKSELTNTTIEQFKEFMKFIADNKLWEDVEQHLKSKGITEIDVSSAPIAAIRLFITDRLLASARLDRHGQAQALAIARCTCGSGTPGAAGHGPVSPSGGGDGGTGDGGHHPT
jgi:hypothetical protein